MTKIGPIVMSRASQKSTQKLVKNRPKKATLSTLKIDFIDLKNRLYRPKNQKIDFIDLKKLSFF